MKAIIFIFLSCCIGVISLCYFAYKWGETNNKKETVSRAKEIVKESYNNADIDYIVFGEIQK